MEDEFFSLKANIDIRVRFYVIFGILGGVLLFAYAISNVIVMDYPFVFLELILSLISFFLAYETYRTRSLRLASNWGLIPIFVISLTNFVFGGFNGTGILWTYLLPLVVVFISGGRKGLLTLGIFIGITAVHMFGTSQVYPNTQDYSLVEYITFLVSFSTISFMTWLFQTSWDTSDRYLTTERAVERQYKEDLVAKVDELEKVKKDLENSLQKTQIANAELQKINSLIIGRELKMKELKDKIKELEEEDKDKVQS